jgi:tetratricopeptide (TPR) repeat protein
MKIGHVMAFAALALAAPVVGKVKNDADIVDTAARAVGSDPSKALALVEPLIVTSGVMTPKPETDYICTNGSADTLAKLVGKAAEKRNAIAVGSWVCSALFIKGFVLIDLNRRNEAEPYLRRATELDPTNAHYLNEYAEWWKHERQWQKSYDLFMASVALAPQQPADVRAKFQARALRGMGFTLIELGRLDDAQRQFDASLKLEPGNRAALSELQYIREQRARLSTKPAS